MKSLVETVREMQAEAISAAQKKMIAAIEKDKKLSDKERFKKIDAVMKEEEGKMCKECGKVHEGSCMGEDNTNDKSDDGEGMDKVQPKALKKKFDDRKDKDIDNDGDEDESDEYLHNRRKTVSKAVKEEEEIDEAPRRKGAPKMTGDSIKIQRAKDKEHADAMGRHVKSGRKKSVKEGAEALEELTAAEKKLIDQMYDKKGNLTPMGKKVMAHGKANSKLDEAVELELDEKKKLNPDQIRKALASDKAKAKGKDKVSLKKAPWDKKEEVDSEMPTETKSKKGQKKDSKNKSGEEIDVEPTLDEASEMTPEQEKMREKYVMKLKSRMNEFKKKYGDRAEKVMYATATKMAMKK